MTLNFRWLQSLRSWRRKPKQKFVSWKWWPKTNFRNSFLGNPLVTSESGLYLALTTQPTGMTYCGLKKVIVSKHSWQTRPADGQTNPEVLHTSGTSTKKPSLRFVEYRKKDLMENLWNTLFAAIALCPYEDFWNLVPQGIFEVEMHEHFFKFSWFIDKLRLILWPFHVLQNVFLT